MSNTLGDPRAYLQKRVALFAGVTCLIFAGVLFIDLNISAEGEKLWSSTRVSSLVVTLSNAGIWGALRRGERSAWMCRLLELSSMAIAMGAMATLPLLPPVEGAGGVMALFSPITMGIVVLLRAATIPSRAWLSSTVALIWGVWMTASSILGWEGISIVLPGQPEGEPWQLPLAVAGFATVAFSVVAGVISHVVYGLETKLRKVMEFGQYTLEAKIGEGGMGAVYRARHKMLRRATAIKLLPPEKSGEQAIARFEREVQETSQLTHPNTVAIFDFGRTQEGIFYYVMEYLDGISLQNLVEMVGSLPPERAIHILLQAAEALSEAHGKGLIHRDIKPDNIVICERGGVPDVVKVLDFGLVKDVDAPSDTKLSTVGSIQGSPLYMAPEAVTAPDAMDARADLYALGAVAYFVLAGEPLFDGSLVEVLAHHLHTQPGPLGDRSARDGNLESVVFRCLEKRPDQRYGSAIEFADALRACPEAGGWTRARARAWWNEERDNIQARRSDVQEPASLTVARV